MTALRAEEQGDPARSLKKLRHLLVSASSAFSLVMVAVPVHANAVDPPPQKTRTATVFGDDPCPPAPEGEIIVCGRLPEAERYRIPKQLRKKPRDESGPSASWASKARILEDAQRFTMPGSCTAVGAGGQSGCTQAMIQQWLLERRALRAERPD